MSPLAFGNHAFFPGAQWLVPGDQQNTQAVRKNMATVNADTSSSATGIPETVRGHATQPDAPDDLAKMRFGAEVLAPILYFSCFRMWQRQTELSALPARALFAARGGLRMSALYDLFLMRQRWSAPITHAPFMVSRLAVSKAVWHRAPALVVPELLRAFREKSWQELGPALLPQEVDAQVSDKVGELPIDVRTERLSELGIYQVLNGSSAYALALRRHLAEQEELFTQYVHESASGCRHLAFCDTGIFGSTQLLLMAAYPEYQWHGLYIGRSRYKRNHSPRFGNAAGLFLDRDRFSTRHPETALLHHWHLLEMPLEPDIPSVTYYSRRDGKVRSNLELGGWQAAVRTSPNPYYQGIVNYFEMVDEPMSEQSIVRRATTASRILQRKICLPSAHDVRTLSVGSRTVDFSFRHHVEVVHPAQDKVVDKLRSVRAAIWKEGQVRIEFPVVGGLINALIFQLGRFISW